MFLRLKHDGVPFPDPYTELDPDAPQTLPITRAAYETLLRRLVVNGKPNVKFVTGTVTGYSTKVGADKLEGVKLHTAQGESIMTGDFIVGKYFLDYVV